VFAATGHADVFVYRGLYKISADLVTGATFGKVTNLYLVVDYDNAQYASILFSNHLVGGRHFVRSSVTVANVSSAQLPKSHTATFFINGNLTNTNPTNFANSALLFRGTDKTLLIRKTPVATPANRPNVLIGAGVSGAESPAGSSFTELHIGATSRVPRRSRRTTPANPSTRRSTI